MSDFARPLLSTSLGVAALLALACGPEGPCRSDEQCEPGQECIVDVEGGAGVCAAALVDDDDPSPLRDGGSLDGGGGVDGGATSNEDGGSPDQPTDAGSPPMAANDVTVGGGFACARTFGDEAFCWGYNSNGQLGNTDINSNVIRPPTRVNGLSDVRRVAAANDHACALGVVNGSDGIYCWGASASGELGTAPGQAAGIPHRVNVADEVHDTAVDLQTGAASTCVLTTGDDVWCWGPDVPGYSLGTPLKLDVFDGAIRLHVSDSAICAKLQTGVLCLDQTGLVQSLCASGLGARECDSLDEAVDFHFTASNVCRLEGGDRVGSLSCAGENDFGVAIPGLPADMAVDFSNLDPGFSTRNVSLGDQHACALGNDSRVRCWGRNLWASTGQAEDYGDPCATGALCHTPLPVPDVPEATDLDTFRGFNCAVADDGALWCWGALGSTAVAPARYTIPED